MARFSKSRKRPMRSSSIKEDYVTGEATRRFDVQGRGGACDLLDRSGRHGVAADERRLGVELGPRDDLFESAGAEPQHLELLRLPQEELDVDVEREADAAEHLVAELGRPAEDVARVVLRHGGE